MLPCIYISSIQTWTLGHLLPVMVDDRVDEEFWQHFLTTLQISAYVLSPEILPEEVSHLNVIFD